MPKRPDSELPADKLAARPGRPRSVDNDRRIHDAVLTLLHADGPDAVTVEAVAASSGVAKTTIYRRFSNREELLRGTLKELIKDPGAPPDASTREKIRWGLASTWHQMADVLGPGGLAAVIADTDERFTTLIRDVIAPYTDALTALIRADVETGALRQGLDADACVSLFVGAYLGELIRRGTVDTAFTESCLDLMWVAMRSTA